MDHDNLWCSISEELPALEDISTFLYDARAGGVNIFVGVTRRWTNGKETQELSYECYEPMAVKEIQSLLEKVCLQWPVVKACVHHRSGVVALGQPSVIIGVATPHRNEAFGACRFLIDELKKRVPIWKQEYYADGSREWISAVPGVEDANTGGA